MFTAVPAQAQLIGQIHAPDAVLEEIVLDAVMGMAIQKNRTPMLPVPQ